MKVLDRYIGSEMLQLVAVGILSLLGMFFLTREYQSLLHGVAQMGLIPSLAFYTMAMHLPEAIVDALPAAIFIATLLVLYRRCVDCEIVALLAAGISYRRILAVP